MQNLEATQSSSRAEISSAFGNTYLFTCRRLDDKTSLHYFRNRYYEPVNGRFVGRDPLSYLDGANLYALVQNNPVNMIDPLGLLLAAIDGTNSRDLLETSEFWKSRTPTGRWRSHVRNFYDDYDNQMKAYWHGPDSAITGWEAPSIHRGVHKWIYRKWCQNKCEKIDLVGHSRGGYIAMEVARALKNRGCDCNGTNFKDLKVRFLGLYDAVDMVLSYGEAETVSSNVQHAAHAFSNPLLGSRSFFNTANHGLASGATTKYRARYFWGTHSALGGDPWGGDKPDRASEKKDIQAAIEADRFIRMQARTAGVPISQVHPRVFGYGRPKTRAMWQ